MMEIKEIMTILSFGCSPTGCPSASDIHQTNALNCQQTFERGGKYRNTHEDFFSNEADTKTW